DAQVCDASIPDTLCLGDPFTVLFGSNGQPVPNILNGAPPGENDITSINELAVINPVNLVTTGLGVVMQQPDGSFGPIRLETTNTYYGLYASDTVDVTDRLALTLGGRYNLAMIRLIDKLGTALNGNNRFARLNPAAGLTYKFLPGLT